MGCSTWSPLGSVHGPFLFLWLPLTTWGGKEILCSSLKTLNCTPGKKHRSLQQAQAKDNLKDVELWYQANKLQLKLNETKKTWMMCTLARIPNKTTSVGMWHFWIPWPTLYWRALCYYKLVIIIVIIVTYYVVLCTWMNKECCLLFIITSRIYPSLHLI